MKSITKCFGSIRALHEVDFSINAGEIMALVGENGAGKSTLVKILTGLYHPDSGSIYIAGKARNIRNAGDSLENGIAVVQQEPSLVPTMSIAENVLLGNRNITGFLGQRRQVSLARPYLELVGLEHLEPTMPIHHLPVTERQLVEVARMISRNAQILILDEPTAALNDEEIDRVKRTIRTLVDKGRSVIYVTHHLPEVFDLANRVTVLRNGKSQPAISVNELSPASLIERMIGRSLGAMFPPRSEEFGSDVLHVKNLLTDKLRSPVSLCVRSGEILGLAGQVDSGTAAVLNAISGAERITGGSISLKGHVLRLRRRRDAVRAGIGHCSAERKKDGIFGIRSVTENLTAPALKQVTPHGCLDARRERTLASRLADQFLIDPSRLRHPAGALSGGNQQKVALGKWLGIEPSVLLINEPTPGVDVGARADIYMHLRQLANEGLSVIFASSDMQEVLGVADTISTFYHGRLINTYQAKRTNMKQLTMDVTASGVQPTSIT